MGWLFCLQSFSQHCNTGTYAMSDSQAWNIRQHSTCQEITSQWNGLRSEPMMVGFSGCIGAKSNYNTFKLICLYNYHSIYIALKGVTYLFIPGNSGKSWCLEFEMHREGQQARNCQDFCVAALKQNSFFKVFPPFSFYCKQEGETNQYLQHLLRNLLS